MNKTLEQLHREDDEILRNRKSIHCPCGCYERYNSRVEMFAEAIATAKQVRATALANAKTAMEEAFNKYQLKG